MNDRIWGIIGGFALVLALISPLVLGSTKKIEQIFEAAEVSYEQADYKNAIAKYKEALKESKKFGAKIERIDKDFTTLVNLKIAQCYYGLAEKMSDIRHYQNALTHIKEVVLDTNVAKHREELNYLWAEVLYKIGDLDQAKSKFSWFIEEFPNSRRMSEILYVIGEINYQQKNCEEALQTFQRLVNEFPQSRFRSAAESRIAELTKKLDPSVNCEAMYNKASDLRRQRKFHDSYERYEDLIAQCPDSEYVTEAYVGMAEIHLDSNDRVNARKYYEEAMYSTSDDKRKVEIHRAYQLTFIVPDRGYVEDIIPPNPIDPIFWKARLFRLQERFLEAAEIYEKLANSNRLAADDVIYVLYWGGYCYYQAALLDQPDLFSKSVDAFKRLIKDYEGSSYAIKTYYYLSLTYKSWAENGDQSKWQLVIDTVESAEAKYADSDDDEIQAWLTRMPINKLETYVSIGWAYFHKGDFEKAEEMARKALKINNDYQPARELLSEIPPPIPGPPIPDPMKKIEPPPIPDPPIPDPEAYVKEGREYRRKGNLEKAEEAGRKALEIADDYPPAHELLSKIKKIYYDRARTFLDEEQYDKAITECENAINIDPNFKEAHGRLGVIYIEWNKPIEAIEPLKKAIRVDENYKQAHYNLALVYLKRGEFKASMDAAESALRIDPNYEPALRLKGYIDLE